MFSLLLLLLFGSETKNSSAVNAIIKLPTSATTTPFSPAKAYKAVAIKGFNMEINDRDRERSALVF